MSDDTQKPTMDERAFKEALLNMIAALRATITRLESERDEWKQAPAVPDGVIAGALFDFLGYLTTRDETLCMGAAQECSPVVPALQAWAKTRVLNLDDADVKGWRALPTPPKG